MSILHSIPKEKQSIIPVEWQLAIAVLHHEFPGITLFKTGEPEGEFTGISYIHNGSGPYRFTHNDLEYRALRTIRYPDLAPFTPDMLEDRSYG